MGTKRSTYRSRRQTGTSVRSADRKRSAKKPGVRFGPSGKYYERRANRSDKRKYL